MGIFRELAQSRQALFAPMPLPLAEIDAYVRLSGMALQWWEVRALRQLDQLWMRTWIDARPKDPAPTRRVPTGA